MQDAPHEPEHAAPPDSRTLERIRGFRLIDDLFMRICFAYNFVCARTVLRIVLNRPKLEVVSVQVQHTVQALPGRRSLQVDLLIRDSAGGLHNLEMQRKDADARRFRLHAAMLDASELGAGADFADLPELNVIFILERDPLKQGLPLYEFVRYMPEHELPLNDGVRVVLVNGEIRGRETELAELMHDIFCADPDEMYIEELAEVVRYFKQTDKGVREMSSVIEEIREEGRTEGERAEKTATVLQLVKMGGFTPESIAEITRLGVDEVREIVARHAG